MLGRRTHQSYKITRAIGSIIGNLVCVSEPALLGFSASSFLCSGAEMC